MTNELSGQIGRLTAVVTITRKATGLTETYNISLPADAPPSEYQGDTHVRHDVNSRPERSN